jgi:hypothetical protein
VAVLQRLDAVEIFAAKLHIAFGGLNAIKIILFKEFI